MSLSAWCCSVVLGFIRAAMWFFVLVRVGLLGLVVSVGVVYVGLTLLLWFSSGFLLKTGHFLLN
jgi:hypothetical protein